MLHSKFYAQPSLSQAVFTNDINRVRTLVLNRENVNSEDSEGRSPLHAASFIGNGEIADYLILSGARVDKKDCRWQTPLHYACTWCRPKIVEVLVIHQADVGQRDRHWQTALHICAANNAVQCAEFLLPLSTKIVNIGDRGGRTPLHIAAFCGFLEMVELLLRHGADVNARDKSERRPVHFAAYSGHLDISTHIIGAGADFGARDKNHATALHSAAAGGHDEICSYLISQWDGPKVDTFVNAIDKDGNTALHMAATNGKELAAKVLLENGARVNTKNNSGMTPLHLAAASTDGSAYVDMLVAYKADVNGKSTDGRTPLHMLASYGRLKQAQSLLDSGADVNAADKEGDTALHIAARYGHDLLIKKLITAGADVKLQNSNGVAPFHLACHRGYVEPVKTLFENNSDVFAVDNHGRNCLHYAAFSSNDGTKCIEFLLENGASVASADEFWRLPLHYACMADSADHLECLLKAGSDVNAHDIQGRQPLHYAAALETDTKCAFLLLQHGAISLCYDWKGWTPLHYAAYRGHVPLSEYLVSSKKKEEIDHLLRRLPRTPLHLAAYKGHNELLEMLLTRTKRADPRDVHGGTPLHLAAYAGHLGCVKALLNASANCLAVDKVLKTTPMHVAAGYRQAPMLRMLISQHLNDPTMANAFDCHKRTPVMLSVSNGAAESVQFLLSLNPDVMVKDTKGRTALHRAAYQGLDKVMEMLLHQLRYCQQVEQAIFARDNSGRTAFHYAAQTRHLNVLSMLLLEVTPDINTKQQQLDLYDTWGQTPLHWACFNGAVDCVELLLDCPFNFHLLEERGAITSLQCAAAIGSEVCCELLLDRGFRNTIEKTDEMERTALHLASSRGFTECVRVLLEAGAFVNATDQRRRTPLMYAAASGHCQVVEKLIESEADWSAVDVCKWTALHHACLKGREDTASLLIAAANVDFLNFQGQDGKTAMHIAARAGLVTVVEKLLLAGASVTILDDNDQTPALCCTSDQNTADALSLIMCGMFPEVALTRLSSGNSSTRVSICGQNIADMRIQSKNNTVGQPKENASASGQSSDSEFF